MPKIIVNEKDISWYYNRRSLNNLTVYCPGTSTFGPSDPTLVDAGSLEKLFGQSVGADNDYSYHLAMSYAQLGYNVLFHRFTSDSATKAKDQMIYYVRFDAETLPQEGLTVTVGSTEEYTFTPDTPYADIPIRDQEHYDLIYAAFAPYFPSDSNEFSNPTGEETPVNDGEDPQDEGEDTDPTISEMRLYGFIGDSSVSDKLKGYRITAKYVGSFGSKITVGCKKQENSTSASITVYVSNVLVESFLVDYGNPMSQNYYSNDLSNYITFEFMGEFGEFNGVIPLYGGSDQSASSTTSYYAEIVDKLAVDYESSPIKDLEDNLSYPFDIATCGGFYDYDDYTRLSRIDNSFLNLVKRKGTAIYFVDGDASWTHSQFYNYCGLFDSSYCTAYGPYSYTSLVSNGAYVLLPGTYVMLKTWANSLAEGNPVWAVPAGVSRGQVPSVTGTKYNVGQAVLAEWQSDYDEFNANVLENYKVNPIMKLRQYGYVINGNATLLKTQNGARSLTDQLSVRVIANLIKSQAYDYALGLQFGQMSDDLFAKFKTLLDTYLGQLVYQGALYDYKITMNTSMISTSLNTRTIPVLIQISPVPAVENFDITLEISRAGVVFTDNE